MPSSAFLFVESVELVGFVEFFALIGFVGFVWLVVEVGVGVWYVLG